MTCICLRGNKIIFLRANTTFRNLKNSCQKSRKNEPFFSYFHTFSGLPLYPILTPYTEPEYPIFRHFFMLPRRRKTPYFKSTFKAYFY